MMKGSYMQLTVKFPTTKERYRQAVECVAERDKGIYPTQADYLTSAILFFEGKLTDERTSLSQILEAVRMILEKLDEKNDERKKDA